MTDSGFSPKTIALYSVGLLGGSLGLGLKASGYKGEIIGISSEKNLAISKDLGCIDKGYSYDELQSIIKDVDLLILCSPIYVIMSTIEKLGKMELPKGLVISDVGSTKREIVDLAKKVLPDHVYFIGGHPMAGSEKSGPSAADPYLFQNAMYVLTPVSETASDLDKAFASFLEKYLCCRYLFLDPSIHDTIAASVSHVPHILAVALVLMAHDVDQSIPGALSLAAGGFRDMTRIASAPYDMWHDILSTNKVTITPLLDKLIKHLETMKQQFLSESLKEPFETAREIRAKIPMSSKGFINRLSEILVVAKDQPGFIASMTSALAQKNINIKDIEVLKVREGEGGTFRLAFETAFVAKEAIAVLAQHGFTARERT